MFANPILLRRFIRQSQVELGSIQEPIDFNPPYAMKDWNPYDLRFLTEIRSSQALLSQTEVAFASQINLTQQQIDQESLSIPPHVRIDDRLHTVNTPFLLRRSKPVCQLFES